MLAAIIPIVVAFGLLFSVPKGLAGLPLFGYALATLLSLRVAISFFYVPYMALGAEMTDDYAERSSIVAGRVFFTVIGGLAAAILMWGVFLKGPHGRFDAAAYSPLAWTLSGIVAFGALVSTFGTLRGRGRLHAAPTQGRFGFTQFMGELLEVLKQPLVRQPLHALPDPLHRARRRRRADTARQHLLLEAERRPDPAAHAGRAARRIRRHLRGQRAGEADREAHHRHAGAGDDRRRAGGAGHAAPRRRDPRLRRRADAGRRHGAGRSRRQHRDDRLPVDDGRRDG